jgi:DNA-binding transcriptional LysR family regulator
MTHPIDLELLRSFVAVAEELSFVRAARRLHIAQPPLSMRIRRLEAFVGARLLDRSRQHVAVTEAGAHLLERARHLLAEAARAAEETGRIARGEGGSLRVGYTPTATFDVLPQLLQGYRARYPDVRLELREMRSALQTTALAEGGIEIGFVCAPVAADRFERDVLAEERLVLALPERHPLARRARVPVRALDALPMVLVDPAVEPGWARPAQQALLEARIAPRFVQQTDGKIAQLGLVAAGVGAALVSESVGRLRREGVVLRPVDGLHVRLRLEMLSSRAPSPRAAAWRALALASMAGRKKPVPARGALR